MQWSPRIVVPILLALLLSIGIGSIFFLRIQTSIQFIERSIEESQGKKSNTSLLSRIRGRAPNINAKDLSKTIQSIQEGALFESKGMIDRAEERYRYAIENGGGNDARVFLIHLLRKKGDVQKATMIIQESENNGGISDDLLLEKGLLLLKKNPNEAREFFEALGEKTNVQQYGKALVAMTQGDHRASENAINAMQESDDHWKRIRSTLRNAYQEFALFEHGEDVHRDTLLARALAEIDECPTAQTILTNVLTTKDDYRDAWIVQGYCELMSGATKDALTSLERAYAIDPIKPEIQYFLARAYFNLGDPQNAITFLQYAISNGFEPKNDARNLLIEYAKEGGSIDLALENLQILLQEESALSTRRLQDFTALALSTQERALKALSFLEEVQKKNPESVPLLVASIQCAEIAKEEEKRTQLVHTLQMIDPQNALLQGKK